MPEQTAEPALDRAPEPAARGARLPRDQRRAQLLAAAGAVFAEKGYHATAMDDVADRAGVSKPVLYQHFGSKLDLYLDLLDGSCERLSASLTEALRTGSDNGDRVRATMGAFFDAITAPGDDFRLVFESDLTAEPAVTERLDRLNASIASAVAVVIADDTGLGEAQALLLGTALVGLAQVSARAWVDSRPALAADEAKTLASELAWRGISGFPLATADRAERA